MEYIGQLATSLSTCVAVGVLFWAWQNSRFKSLEDKVNELKADLRQMEERQGHFIEKSDHNEIRLEDKKGLEYQIRELREDMKDMPERIVNMIQQFIKKI